MYLDLVVALNITINYFLLLLTGHITREKTNKRRLFLSSTLGTAFLLLLLLPFPGTAMVVSWLGKTLLPLVMVFVAFYPRHLDQWLKLFLVFYLCSLSLGGLIFAFSMGKAYTPQALEAGSLFLTPSLIYFPLAGAALYGAFRLFGLLLVERLKFFRPSTEISLEICFRGKKKLLPAFLDTGNMLKEPFSGTPVAIANYSSTQELLPPEVRELIGQREPDWTKLELFLEKEKNFASFYLIPYYSLHESGFLLAFKPEEVCLWERGKKLNVTSWLVIGIRGGDNSSGSEVILPLEFLQLVKRGDPGAELGSSLLEN